MRRTGKNIREERPRIRTSSYELFPDVFSEEELELISIVKKVSEDVYAKNTSRQLGKIIRRENDGFPRKQKDTSRKKARKNKRRKS